MQEKERGGSNRKNRDKRGAGNLSRGEGNKATQSIQIVRAGEINNMKREEKREQHIIR